jgi:hypothetical protein
MQIRTDVSEARWPRFFRWSERLKMAAKKMATLKTEGEMPEYCNESYSRVKCVCVCGGGRISWLADEILASQGGLCPM